MRNHYAARYVRISVTTIDPAFTCPWIKIHRIHGPYSLSARSSRFLKSEVYTIATNGALPKFVWCGSTIRAERCRRRHHLIIRRDVDCPVETRADDQPRFSPAR